MEPINFTPGKQEADTIVKDIDGVYWKVLQDIANAKAQPRQGQYYTRIPDPVVVQQPIPKEDVKYIPLHPDDFYIEQIVLDGVIINERVRTTKPKNNGVDI